MSRNRLENQFTSTQASRDICLISNSLDDQLTALGPLIKSALSKNRQCIYLSADPPIQGFIDALDAGGVDTTRALHDQSLLFLGGEGQHPLWSLALGESSGIINQWLGQAKKHGFNKLTLIVDATPPPDFEPTVDYVAKWRKLWQTLESHSSLGSVCVYRMDRLGSDLLLAGLTLHPKVLISNELVANPYVSLPLVKLDLPDPQNRSELIEWMVSHLKELRSQQEQTSTSEGWMSTALDAAGVGAWYWDKASNEICWSSNLERIHGLEPGSFKGTFESFVEEIHPEDRNAVLQAVQKALESQGHYRAEYRVTQADGSVCWLAAMGQVILDAQGNPQGITGTCTDITNRIETQQELQRTQQDLTDFIENAPVGLHWVGPDGTILWANQEELELLGSGQSHIEVGRAGEELIE